MTGKAKEMQLQIEGQQEQIKALQMIIPNYSQYNEIPHNQTNDYAVSV